VFAEKPKPKHQGKKVPPPAGRYVICNPQTRREMSTPFTRPGKKKVIVRPYVSKEGGPGSVHNSGPKGWPGNEGEKRENAGEGEKTTRTWEVDDRPFAGGGEKLFQKNAEREKVGLPCLKGTRRLP